MDCLHACFITFDVNIVRNCIMVELRKHIYGFHTVLSAILLWECSNDKLSNFFNDLLYWRQWLNFSPFSN